MIRIDDPDAEPDLNGPGRPGFLERPPPESPTLVPDTWLNHVQEELARSIELLGGTLNPASKEQLGTLLATMKAVTDSVGPRIVSDEWTYPTPKTRTVYLPVSASVGTTDAAGAPEWSIVELGPSMPYAISKAATAKRFWNLTGIVPPGATITRLRALVQPEAGHAPGDRMSLSATRFAISGASITSAFSVGPFDDSGGSGADEWIDSGAISLFAVAATFIEVYVRSSVELDDDAVLLLEVTFSDPGPRNG